MRVPWKRRKVDHCALLLCLGNICLGFWKLFWCPQMLCPFSFPFSFYSHTSLNTIYTMLIQNTPFCVLDGWTSSLPPRHMITHYFPPRSDVKCKTAAQADIVLLVDGSWSIGRLNFKTIRAFIARMVGVFDISPDRVQIGGSTGQRVTCNNMKMVFLS